MAAFPAPEYVMILPGYDEDACHFLKNPGSREALSKTRCGQADPAQDVRLPLKSEQMGGLRRLPTVGGP